MNPMDPVPSRLRSTAGDESSAAVLLRAWQQGDNPDLDTYLAGLPGISLSELSELIRIDLEAHWDRGQQSPAEDYLRRFPAVAADGDLAVDVIYAEFLARELAGQQPELAEYQRRFPEYYGILEEQISFHAALACFDREALSEQQTLAVEGASTATYEILEQIGSGGMGVVYKAHQASLNRFVALKMLRAIDAGNPELLKRFRAEAQVVASLRHPHIVQVYGAGEHDGLPYLAMEFVEGGTLADRMTSAPWPPRTAADLLVTLAGAVQFAHDHHVVHRDLKPANVLVAADTEPLEVKITDFGLAKLLADEANQQTKSYAFLGTPSYMAPEQARGRTSQIGPVADVYSLGAILFELLTGRPPYLGETPMETLRLLHSGEPVTVHPIAPSVPRDLATICDRCLEREAQQRYQSAAELQDDLRRYLEGKPIQARPTSSVERAWRWCRRNPLLAAALGVVLLLLVSIAGLSLANSARLQVELSKTQQMEQSERTANQSAQSRLWDAYLSEASARSGSHRVGQRFASLELVDKASALLGTVGRTPERLRQLRNSVLAAVSLPDIRTVSSLAIPHDGSSQCDISVTIDQLAISSEEGAIVGYRHSDGKQLWRVEGFTATVRPLFSPDGSLLAAIDAQGSTVFNLSDTQPRELWRVPDVKHFSFAPDRALAAYSHRERGMCLVRADNGEIVRTMGVGQAQSDFAFDPHSSRIAVCGLSGVQIITGDSGAVECELPTAQFDGPKIAWHPAGELLATWTDPTSIALWHVSTRKKVHSFAHRGLPARLAFSQDGALLVSETMWNQHMLVWSTNTLQRILEVVKFSSHVGRAANDGSLWFVSINRDRVEVSELSPGARHELAQALDSPLGYWGKVSVSPEGRILAFSSQECLELWDAQTSRRLWARAFGGCTADFDDAGRLIVSCDRGLFRFARHIQSEAASNSNLPDANHPQSKTLVRFDSMERLADEPEAWSVSTNASGQTAALFDGKAEQWQILSTRGDGRRFDISPEGDPRKSSVSDDDRLVAISGWELGGAGVWNAQTGEKLVQLSTGRHGVPLFSPDSKYLATTPDGITLWRTDDWKVVRRMNAVGTTPAGLSIAFSPDSRVLAVGQVGRGIDLVDPASGAEWASLPASFAALARLISFSPDQRWLITSASDETSSAQVWDLVAMRRALSARGLDWPADVLKVRPNELDFERKIEIEVNDEGMFPAKTEGGSQLQNN